MPTDAHLLTDTQWTQPRKIIFLRCLFSANTRSLGFALLCTADGCGFSTDGYNKNFKIRSRSLSQKFCVRWKTLHNPDVDTHTYRHSAKQNHGTSDEEKREIKTKNMGHAINKKANLLPDGMYLLSLVYSSLGMFLLWIAAPANFYQLHLSNSSRDHTDDDQSHWKRDENEMKRIERH